MKLTEIKQDLFELPNDYTLVHCISHDCALGAGIAKTFTEKYPTIRKDLKEHIKDFGVDVCECMMIRPIDERHNVINMITKEKYWNKPTINDFNKTVDDLVLMCYMYDIKKLGMPKIGCGLDKLNWKDVRNKLESTFKELDIEIIVCYL